MQAINWIPVQHFKSMRFHNSTRNFKLHFFNLHEASSIRSSVSKANSQSHQLRLLILHLIF
ncbi:hypothetical protein Hanom_Chr16g01521071 [Helianthus anomalus]